MDLDAISKEAEAQISNAADLNSLDKVRVEYLGKKGRLTELLKGQMHKSARLPVNESIKPNSIFRF